MAELLELAKTYDGTQNVIGFFASAKLDGIRAFWDGGITRGMHATDVPWADCGQAMTSTGLWSRYGHVIHAPDWWLDKLPPIALDGELWSARKQFQKISSVVRKHTPIDSEWKSITYCVFDSPPWLDFLAPRKVKNAHSEINIGPGGQTWINRAPDRLKGLRAGATYIDRWHFLCDELEERSTLTKVFNHTVNSVAHIEDRLEEELDLGGEGLILHDPQAKWQPKRHSGILKVKPAFDAEGVVSGYTEGKGKHAGRLGALIVEFRGKQFKLSGFMDQEREEAKALFPVGSRVTFTYRELSDGGCPKEARYCRKAVPA